MIAHKAKESMLADIMELIGSTGTVDMDTPQEKWYVRVLGTQSIGCFRFEPCSTIEDERRHEEGKLEFRDAEDDAAPVGWDEEGTLECERRRKSTEEKG
ncbi:hypothetical protein G5I_07245 [Acromyrmex echinatior]|uniref:Uncharacterized protein n=1 Tax=Acromyrmex echinatior TaxID=103372 RepID=F4WN95_ACREC|nr:hypothetical protein G5I_07245 [Acromyrmex echinatior]